MNFYGRFSADKTLAANSAKPNFWQIFSGQNLGSKCGYLRWLGV